MGGKSSTQTSSVSIPPEVLAEYNTVNADAQKTAQTPFQSYSSNPNAFVAPLNSAETSGIADTTAAANEAQPYYQAATGQLEQAQNAASPYYQAATGNVGAAQGVGSALAGASQSALGTGVSNATGLQSTAAQNITGAQNTGSAYDAGATGAALAGGQAVDPTQLTGQDINQYLSPYLRDVAGTESSLLNQENQQAQAGQLGNAITSGAFGGDRAGIAAANLNQQEQLGNSNILSNILNTGYNNALSTAQQQQGVGLSAGQANRAAVQNEETQLQSIGQQDYAQGLGAAQQQQSLGGQEYGQGLSTAQQEAALGEQQFGQGITSANTEAGLGQDIYNTGAATSAAEANLGAGAQSSALSGAQAQLAAGQVAQTTDQAGRTALYNQFEQQQSYPFQVDQFLANIAEGTGALSGSTTTSTTPGGLFSDERLKEDIEPVGETYDGQKIVKFRYKGDNKTQVGLLAQDVEKHHPDAVGSALGYKTVDYDKATRKAASRGHFAYGGLAGGVDPYQGMVMAQEGMYGPYEGSGLYGGASSGAVHGGSSYVPQANLPVRNLAVAQSAPQPPSGLDQATQIANLATKVGTSAQTMGGWLQKHGVLDGQTAANSNGSEAIGSSRGGFRKALGGGLNDGDDQDEPYIDQETGPHLNIPDQTPTAKLGTANATGQSQNNSLDDIASIASDAAKVLPMILSLATGGAANAPDDDMADDDMRTMLASLFQPSPQDPDDGGQEAPQGPATGLGQPDASSAVPADPGNPGLRQALSVAKAVSNGQDPNTLQSVLPKIEHLEGTGKNPTSSAQGPYQLIDPTFVGMFKQMFPDRAQGMSRSQILALRATPEGSELSAQMGPELAKQNMATLAHNGFEPSAPNVYLAHFLGPQGAMKVLGADPQSPLSSLLSPKAIGANKSIMQGRSAGDLIGWSSAQLARAQRQGYASGGLARAKLADGGTPDDSDPLVAIPDDSTPEGLGVVNTSPAPVKATGLVAQVPSASAPETQAKPASSGMLGGIERAAQGALGSLAKPEVFIPLLTGLAAFGAAPTRNFGVALTQGLGAAGQAAQAQRAFGLQQQQTAQHGHEVNIEQQLADYKPWELTNESVRTAGGLLGNGMPVLNTRYSKLAQIGPDGQPTWRDNWSGQTLTTAQHGQRVAQFYGQMGQMASGLPGGSGIASALTSTGGASDAAPVPNVLPGPVSGNPAGPVGSGPAAGGVANGPGTAVPGPRAVPGVVGNAQVPVAPGASLEQKVKSGAYLAKSQPLPSVDYSRLDPNSNPQQLMQQGYGLIRAGGDQESIAAGQQMIQRAQDIEGGKVPAMDTDGQPDMQFNDRANAQTLNQSVTGSYADQIAKRNSEASSFANEYAQSQQILNSLKRVYSDTNTNRLSEDWAQAVGAMRSIPGLGDTVSPDLAIMQSNVDESKKDSARQAIMQAVAEHMASHAPASALHQANLTVPGPTMSPGARYNLVVQMQALLDRSKDQYADWNKYSGQVQNVQGFDQDWMAQHPVETYEKSAYGRTVPFAGMTQQEMLAHPLQPKSPADLKGVRPGVPFRGPDGKVWWTR